MYFVLADNQVLSGIFQVVRLDVCPISSFKWLLGFDDPSWCLFISLRYFKYLHVASIATKCKDKKVMLYHRGSNTK